jgi:hypothetical protein
LELQSDYTASFAIAKQALKIPAAFAAHVANVAVSLHERSRHLVLGLALGRGAHNFGGGRLRYNLTSLKTKKEQGNIINAISHYYLGEVAVHFLMLVQPLQEPGKMDPKHAVYLPSILR